MSQTANAQELDTFPDPEEIRERRMLVSYLAQIVREVQELVRLIDAAGGDSLAYSETHEPIMELLALMKTADDLAAGLTERRGVTSSGRAAAESARAALELTNTAMTIAISRNTDFDS